MPEPEIILPGEPATGLLSDRSLDRLARALDDAWTIPGTSIGFGLDPIVGLLPGVGDIITGLLSFVIVYAAWQRRLAKITIFRMVINIVIDTLIGSIPVAGDLFDIAWKSNRMNYNLLTRGKRTGRSQAWRDWAFLLFLVAMAAAVMIVPVITLILLVHWIFTGYWLNAR